METPKVKKIFILTGEASGDKLASKVVSNLRKIDTGIEYLSVGGENLNKLGVKSIYNLKEITYLGFTNVILNIFKIKRKINETVKAIENFSPDILFTVDSPDFTLRVAEKVKRNNPDIKTIHYVAPQVWVWREERVKKIKKFIDHIFLLFNFEKPFFEKENMSHEFVGHPLLEPNQESAIDLNQILGKNKALISIFAGSRKSEIEVLTPILLKFIELMNEKYNDFTFIFHSTKEYSDLIQSKIQKINLKNCEVISDDKIKKYILQKSVFAVSKSGTVSLEICNAKIPSIIIYKMGYINFLIVKMLVKIKFANIINIAAKKEIIPELLQFNCNAKKIFEHVSNYLDNPSKMEEQLKNTQLILKDLKTKISPSKQAAESLLKFL
ncbi:lipid-A-disaccharide synthase [Candidatus Pelagibacter bacterium]|nr:lipid-A-disaccharide synthase [Candidatus Pelagibacter bacterium]